MIGAYQRVPAFAYPGWRLTVPGGPAGGHYKGFTHNYSAGTDIPPEDSYEQDREDGMSSHDPVSASPRNPRGVYRSSAEVPPRANASGAAMTYTGYQDERGPGDSVAPGSFPAPFFETLEDFLAADLGLSGARADDDGPVMHAVDIGDIFLRRAPQTGLDVVPMHPADIPDVVLRRMPPIVPPGPGVVNAPTPTITPGAMHVVAQPAAAELPALPSPSPSVPVVYAPPISPRPAPVVSTPDVIQNAAGDFIRVSDGAILSSDQVEQHPATGQLRQAAGTTANWLEQHSIWSAVPNWAVVAGGLGLFFFLGGRRR